MSTMQLLKEINKLPVQKRLSLIEKTLLSIKETKNVQLIKAVNALLKDYKSDKELTAFTALDFENFYQAR